jgi:predicted SAM-dependent methyltransferase
MLDRLKRTQNPIARSALLRAAGLAHASHAGHAVGRRRTREYLAGTDEPKLQFGAGPFRLPGWLNTDLISGEVHVDLTRPLPFDDGVFAYAFGEHVIEHLADDQGARLLAELHRVLRPGGVLRLTTPDLQKIVALYEDRNPVISRADYVGFLDRTTGRPHGRPAQLFNDYLRLWGHRWVYDEEDLTARLREAGFAEVVRVDPGESDHAPLRGLERHGGEEWVNRAEAMCLEATRSMERG